MKKQTLLFGAGEGSKNFIQNEMYHRNFLAYIDNDPKKYGSLCANLEVFSPLDIGRYDYDEIVITTQWANEVKKQLINEIGIDPSKVIIPSKSLLKKPQPFRDEKTRQLARDIIKTLASQAIKEKVELSLDFGTLLGIVRDNDIILWDDDVDFAAPVVCAEEIEVFLKKTMPKVNSNIQWIIDKQKDKNNQIVSFQIKFLTNESMSPFTTSITFRKNIDGNSIHLSSLGQWYAPSHHFDTLAKITWQEVEILIPTQVEDYLTFMYGDWEQPKENMTMDDYNNIGETSFENFNDAKLTLTRVVN